MAATIKIKNSSTTGAVPTSSDLVQGELAVNVTDKRIFTENASGTVVELGTNPSILTIPDGSASAPTLTNDGDTNTGIFFPAADTVGISTGGTERARFDSSGNLGLGVTPSAWGSGRTIFQLGNTNSYVVGKENTVLGNNAFNDGTNWKYLTTGAAAHLYSQLSGGSHAWYTSSTGTAGNTITFTQAMTLDASGNLGVGVTSVGQRVEIGGSGDVYAKISSSTNTGYRGLSMGINGNSDIFGSIAMEVNNGQLRITSGYAGWGGYTTFYTNGSERARIDSSGNLLVAAPSASGFSTNTTSTGKGLYINGYTYQRYCDANTSGRYWYYGAEASAAGTFLIYNANSTGVYLSYGGTSWAANSDERLKDIIEPITNATEKVGQLRAVIGKYKSDEDGTRRSFLIAQDVQAVLPEATSTHKLKDDDTEYIGVSYTDTIPLLVAAIKEQQAIITALTARITALEQA